MVNVNRFAEKFNIGCFTIGNYRIKTEPHGLFTKQLMAQFDENGINRLH